MSKSTCEVIVRRGDIAAHGDCLLSTVRDTKPGDPGHKHMEVWMGKTLSPVMHRPLPGETEPVPVVRVERTSVKLNNGERMDAGMSCDGRHCDNCKCAVYPDTPATRTLLGNLRRYFNLSEAREKTLRAVNMMTNPSSTL